MKRLGLLFAVVVLPTAAFAADDLAWQPITRECKPWAYWWWMGSAVDTTNITRELTRYRDAGLGGVHIIPIYGAKGFEAQYIPYLSTQWMAMLRHTVSEATRLNLGVDMTTGSGWCFGGPNVRDFEANALVQGKTFDVAAGEKLAQKFYAKQIQALVAFPADGKPIELTSRISADGTVDWTAPSAMKVYAITQKPSGQKVKRPAPGGEGHMLNLLYPDGVSHFLERFTEAFANYTGPKPRAMYHDSYEYRTDWSPDFFAQFEKRHGYRLQDELPALFTKEHSDHSARVKCDYRETASDIMVEQSLPLWVNWSHARGFITRNEAHGSPGNLLDLYAAADVPETEMFNKDRNKLITKFASSAAHVAGRKLVGCETGTWLKEHFTETLADVKYLADDVFLSGVNHIFYHGTCYSPDEAGWPGWLFYASTEMNPRNSIWRDAVALNTYIARCQAVLQSGTPNNDILLYWPIHDFWQTADGMLPHLTVHARNWFERQPIGKLAEQLWNRGYTFDYVSDRQLAQAAFTNGMVRTRGAQYRAIVVPRCEHMPVETLAILRELAEKGAHVVFEGALPRDVPGAGNLEKRRVEFAKVAERAQKAIHVGSAEEWLAKRVARERLVDHNGLQFIRRAVDDGRDYFIANRGDERISRWIPLATGFAGAALLDPITGRVSNAATRGTNEVFLELESGESVIVRAFTKKKSDEATKFRITPTESLAVAGSWKVEFISGGPSLPPSFTTTNLSSWTTAGVHAERFAGTARYTLNFDAPGTNSTWLLDLGRVCQSARVRLNGHNLGTLFTPPFRMRIDGLKERGNLLEVEITNVSANRIRDLDRRGAKWKNFQDINIVNMDYKPFDASNWPLADSGLLGPVTLQPTKLVPLP